MREPPTHAFRPSGPVSPPSLPANPPSAPPPTTASADDEQEVINLVLFLENRHVRQLDVAERRPLDGKPGDAWHAAFAEYLDATGCPLLGVGGYVKARVPEFLHWLVGHAFSVAYEDGA